ncbi:hypothetical protein A2U01_0106224, partial [Trifolium medium]|nr:hypothetical protein [Trifolium medium]
PGEGQNSSLSLELENTCRMATRVSPGETEISSFARFRQQARNFLEFFRQVSPGDRWRQFLTKTGF